MRLPWMSLLVGMGCLFAGGCHGCRATPVAAVPVERLLSPTSDWVVLSPALGRLGADASALSATLATLPEGEIVAEGLRQLSAGLGFDPLIPQGLASVGLDPARGAALAQEGGVGFVALPVADPTLVVARVARMAAERLGATQRERQASGVLTFSPPASAVAAALGFRDGYALLAQGPAGAQLIGRLLAQAKAAPSEGSSPSASARRSAEPPSSGAPTLEGDPTFVAASGRLGPGFDLVLYLPAASSLLPRPPHALPGRAFISGLAFSKARLTARVLALLSVPEGAALSALSLPAGQGLVALLAPAAPILARLGGEPAAMAQAWRGLLPRELQRRLDGAGIDFGRDVLQNLKPGIALSLGLAPGIDLSAPPTLDPRRENPFRYVALTAVAQARDPVRAQVTLAKLLTLAPILDATVVRRSVGSQPIDTFHYARGEGVSVALAGDTVLVTGGEGAMEAALGRVTGKGARFAPSPALAHALVGHVSDGLALDTDALLAAVERIPPSAYGGLTGLTLRSLVDRLSEPLRHLGPLVATVNFEADAAIADATIPFR